MSETIEKDDYELDVMFGKWLRDLRVAAGLSLEDAAKHSGLPEQRLKSLEVGYAEKGITQRESETLSRAYKVPLKEILQRASK